MSCKVQGAACRVRVPDASCWVHRAVPGASCAAALLFGLSITVAAQPALTFSKDVAPIVFTRCVPCHRPGEIGPFSLLSYQDVKQRVSQIADVTARRVMPPWKPEPGEERFIDERALTPAELKTIQDWIAQGAVEGDARDLPPLPDTRAGWALGTPDVIVTMPDPYVLAPDGPDVFRTFVLPIPTTTSRYVRAVEFRPGNARAVHHANIGVDRTRSSRRLDRLDAEPGYKGGMVPTATYPPGHMLGWTPGQRPRPSPAGMPWRLERESDLVTELHMQPTGKPEPVQVSVGLYFSDAAPTRAPIGLRLGSETIDIKPGDAEYVIEDRYVVPVDSELHAIQPHAHNLGRHMEATATFPDQSTRRLIAINEWDFRWQDVYRYAQPIVLPKGTTIRLRFTYDNSAANPRNPYQPPRRIVWGQNTTDEMGDLWLQLVPRRMNEFAALSADVERKRRTEDLAAYAKLVRDDPDNPLRRDTLAMLYLQNGRAREATAELRESLKLNPESAPTHYNLGLALIAQRQFDEATLELEEAVRLAPDYADAHNNLGAVLHFAGRLDEAERHYRLAATHRTDNAEAENNLARLLLQRGRREEAVTHFRNALAIDPELASALAGLAWIRATSEGPLADPTEALRLAQQADRLTGQRDPVALDALAAAYASLSAFDRATEFARMARQAALDGGAAALADEIAERLKLYVQRVPYVVK
jgi:Tfp pilus assembly protein PilF